MWNSWRPSHVSSTISQNPNQTVAHSGRTNEKTDSYNRLCVIRVLRLSLIFEKKKPLIIWISRYQLSTIEHGFDGNRQFSVSFAVFYSLMVIFSFLFRIFRINSDGRNWAAKEWNATNCFLCKWTKRNFQPKSSISWIFLRQTFVHRAHFTISHGQLTIGQCTVSRLILWIMCWTKSGANGFYFESNAI